MSCSLNHTQNDVIFHSIAVRHENNSSQKLAAIFQASFEETRRRIRHQSLQNRFCSTELDTLFSLRSKYQLHLLIHFMKCIVLFHFFHSFFLLSTKRWSLFGFIVERNIRLERTEQWFSQRLCSQSRRLPQIAWLQTKPFQTINLCLEPKLCWSWLNA